MLVITNKEARPRVFSTKEHGTIVLRPGDNLVEEAAWAEVKKVQWNIKGKKVSAVSVLEKEGAIEEGGKAKAGAEGESLATSAGGPPAAYAGGLPGQGGEDASRRTDEEKPKKK